MTRGILIAGNGSPLFYALGAEAARRVSGYAAAFIPQSRDAPLRSEPARQITLEWNSPSPISARTLVLSAVNRLEHIDEAILVCVPPVCRKRAEDLALPEIDTYADDQIKRWIFLVRELALIFRARESGTLALVLSGTGAGTRDETADLLGLPAAAAFRALAQGVLASSQNAPYNVMGFSCSDPGEENPFAAHIFKTMEEGRRNSGKWHKYGKFSLFR
ncbi:MAG: hypothetical protein LBG84_06750 [Treponema sp.]|jgi:hypothetical protein|nr:hypothetical protein [Treponema sp.]